jgi:hypothetical protein
VIRGGMRLQKTFYEGVIGGYGEEFVTFALHPS